MLAHSSHPRVAPRRLLPAGDREPGRAPHSFFPALLLPPIPCSRPARIARCGSTDDAAASAPCLAPVPPRTTHLPLRRTAAVCGVTTRLFLLPPRRPPAAGNCGSCYAFSIAAALTAQINIAYKRAPAGPSMSEARRPRACCLARAAPAPAPSNPFRPGCRGEPAPPPLPRRSSSSSAAWPRAPAAPAPTPPPWSSSSSTRTAGCGRTTRARTRRRRTAWGRAWPRRRARRPRGTTARSARGPTPGAPVRRAAAGHHATTIHRTTSGEAPHGTSVCAVVAHVEEKVWLPRRLLDEQDQHIRRHRGLPHAAAPVRPRRGARRLHQLRQQPLPGAASPPRRPPPPQQVECGGANVGERKFLNGCAAFPPPARLPAADCHPRGGRDVLLQVRGVREGLHQQGLEAARPDHRRDGEPRRRRRRVRGLLPRALLRPGLCLQQPVRFATRHSCLPADNPVPSGYVVSFAPARPTHQVRHRPRARPVLEGAPPRGARPTAPRSAEEGGFLPWRRILC